ncbi:MAG: acyl-CoA reductase, partial [Paenibacillus sp.]|nr:acyl-CoA reductase [Paenibacillus sp.]
PFADEALLFVQALSQRFVKMRQHPEIVALGFWMRKAHIMELRSEWEKETTNRVFRARGTVFHLAPSNVDTIFVYSWILSLLAGNRNVIRISSKEQMNGLLAGMLEELSEPQFQSIAERTIILTYAHDEATTARLSKLCHTRVVWGGDATVNRIRQIALAPIANELVFPDRFSMSMIRAEAVRALREDELRQLAEQFYNDSFWFDQMACSSPRLILWTGASEAMAESQNAFWAMVERVIEAKQYALAPAARVQKLATGLWMAAEEETAQVEDRQTVSRVRLKRMMAEFRERHCGGGFFYELALDDAEDVAEVVVDKDQTLSYFGYSREELLEIVDQLPTRGIDRIVPIGQALAFQTIWDGQSFLRSFTREIVII